MARTDKLWRSSWLILPVLLGLGAGCTQGGALDPFDNIPSGSTTPPPPNPGSPLPDCSATTGAPCKIALSDLSFNQDSGCGQMGDTMLGMTWNNPNGAKDHVQFGASESSTLSSCMNYESKVCDMTLSALPPLFGTLQASKIRLTFSEKHKLFLFLSTAGMSISGAAVATGTLRFGGKDVLTIAGTLNGGSGGNLDEVPLSAVVAAGADRTLGLRVTTDCGQVFAQNLPLFWSIEGMVAEMLPLIMPEAREVQPFQVGGFVGQRYHIESLIREDDLGWVYEVSETGPTTASSDGLRVALALRLLRPRFSADDFVLSAEARKQWRSQLSLLRELRHPGVVPVHELCLGDEQGRVYTVRAAVELEGQLLSEALLSRVGGLPEPEAVRLCASIAEAVEAAHQRGVQHLSLSPERIFVVPSGESVQIKVADFALMPPALSPLYCGPGYLSPEQIEGQPCDRRTDQFSLAVMFYEMLSGQPAFIGAPDEDRQTILRRVVSEDPLPLALSRPIELALARALSRSRAVRFPGLSDFICALGVDGVAWTAVRPPGPARSQFSPPPRPRTPLYVPVLFGALAASCALGVYFYLTARGVRVGVSWQPRLSIALPDLAAPPPRPDMHVVADLAPPAVPKNPPLNVAQRPVTHPLQPPIPPLEPPEAVPVPPKPAPIKNPPPTVATAPPVVAPLFSAADLDIQVTTDGPPLSPHHLERVKYCVRLVRPRPPFSAILEPFRGTLFVSSRSATPELRESNDFRNCLKNEVQGNIEAKDVSVKGNLRGKSAP